MVLSCNVTSLPDYPIAMKTWQSLSWVFLLSSAGSHCWAKSPTTSTPLSDGPWRMSRQAKAVDIPRGGGISTSSLGLAAALDPKAIATAALCGMVGHCLVDIVQPSKVVQLYGLDPSEEINLFYTSRIGAWGLASVGSLLLQLYTTMPLSHVLGYSFVPIAALTLYQLVTKKYDEVSPWDG